MNEPSDPRHIAGVLFFHSGGGVCFHNREECYNAFCIVSASFTFCSGNISPPFSFVLLPFLAAFLLVNAVVLVDAAASNDSIVFPPK